MSAQVERSLQREVALRLRHAPLDAVLIGSPNGIYLPARSAAEREVARRVVGQLKRDGGLTPGAPDLVFLWGSGCGCIELKRPAERRLFGKHNRGYLSPDQLTFRARCDAAGVRYAVCESWPEVRDILKAWGRLPAAWLDPESRVAAKPTRNHGGQLSPL